MPKIVISEYDKTTAGTGAYANFTVVVPGYFKARTKKNGKWYYGGKTVSSGEIDDGVTVFDENGVYECSDRAEFLDTIGKRPSTTSVIVVAQAPTCEAGWPRTIVDQEEFEALKADRANSPFYICTAKSATEKAKNHVGWLEDLEYFYTAVQEADTWQSTKNYAIILKGNEGVDEENGEQYGNQIAYELLGMGYTILFKKLTSDGELSQDNFWKCLKDKATYDFRYVITGLLTGNSAANTLITNLVDFVNGAESTGRGDAIALLDIDKDVYSGKDQEAAITAITAATRATTASKYAAIFAPSVTYSLASSVVDGSENFGGNKTFPGSFHYLACAARAAENYNEWYAIAGYTRGVSNYAIDAVGCKFGETAIDALEPRYAKGDNYVDKAVNLIVKIKNSYYLWGNRTAYALGAKEGSEGDLRASHFLNIRQLCTTIKKQVYVACRRFTFDPNSDVLWINFCNAIRPTLEKMKADQGISDYKFVKVKSSQKALLTARIRIVPIEAVEDFDISIYLEDSLGGVTTSVDEIEAE